MSEDMVITLSIVFLVIIFSYDPHLMDEIIQYLVKP